MPDDLYRQFELKAEVRDVAEDGCFTGIASVYDVEDLTGDIIDKGAFKKTISEQPNVKILWQHDPREVIGTGEVKEWQRKILVTAKLDLEDPVAIKAYRKLKSGLIDALSIGFQTVKAAWEEREEEGKTRFIRHIQELKLYEISVVTFGAMPQAQVTRVKSADDGDTLKTRLADLEAKVSALTAPPVTPVAPEPTQAAEPNVTAPEPVSDHSAIIEQLDQLKGELKWSL